MRFLSAFPTISARGSKRCWSPARAADPVCSILRDGPYLRSGAELSRAVARLEQVGMLAAGLPGVAHVPPGRVTALARFAMLAKAQAVARLPPERRTATLLAFIRTLEATAQDDVLDLFDIVVTKLFADAAAAASKPGSGPSAISTRRPCSCVASGPS